MALPVVTLTKPLRSAILAGHPWVFDRALTGHASLAAGALATLRDGKDDLAVVYVDPAAPIAARVLSRVPGARIDAGWRIQRVAAAARLRHHDARLADCTGVRLVHGENDGCPGLVIDWYAGTAVVVYDGPAANAFWSPHLTALIAGLDGAGYPCASVWVKGERGVTQAHHLLAPPPRPVVISEGAARFEVDVIDGQKTGFFLDQRDNRKLIGTLAKGLRVLNLYSYNGGFSVHAALGGAAQVTSVDIAPRAINAIAANFRLNGIAENGHTHVCADVFDFLKQARAKAQHWDLVIADPPSFAPNERARPTALAAYQRLLTACADVVATDGRLALASCSSHITERDLLDVAAQTLRGHRVSAVRGAGSDHPILPGFVEGRYLKFLMFDMPPIT